MSPRHQHSRRLVLPTYSHGAGEGGRHIVGEFLSTNPASQEEVCLERLATLNRFWRLDMTEQNTVGQTLKSAEEECERLRAENIRLRVMLGIQDSVSKEPSRTAIPVADDSDTNIAVSFAAERKIALFRTLFRGREDVYAVRWEGKVRKRRAHMALLRPSRGRCKCQATRLCKPAICTPLICIVMRKRW